MTRITPNERITAMAAIALITIVIITLDFEGWTGGVLAIGLAPIGIGGILAVLFLGRGEGD